MLKSHTSDPYDLDNSKQKKCSRGLNEPGMVVQPIILALNGQRQEDQEIKAGLSYIASIRPTWD